MEQAKAAYAAFRAELETLKAKKMRSFARKFRKNHPGTDDTSDALIAALGAQEKKLDAAMHGRLMQAKRKLFNVVRDAQAGSSGAADFVASASFAGSRPGFCFRNGAQGLGYYREVSDRAQHPARRLQHIPSRHKEEDDDPDDDPDDAPSKFPYDPYSSFRKADLDFYRATKGGNRQKHMAELIAPSLNLPGPTDTGGSSVAANAAAIAGANDAAIAGANACAFAGACTNAKVEPIPPGVDKDNFDASAAGAAVAWDQLFADTTLPLVLDVGCGQGKFVLRFALHEAEVAAEATAAFDAVRNTRFVEEDDPYAQMKLQKAAAAAAAAKEAAQARRHNFLGVEMRLGLVEQATQTCAALDYGVGEAGELWDHVAFLHASVNTAFLDAALASYPGPIALFCVQLPDPRLKKNMKRRGTKKLTLERIVQPTLAAVVARHMATGGLVYLSSEYLPLALEMRRFFTFRQLFRLAPSQRVDKCRFLKAEDGAPVGMGGGDLCVADVLAVTASAESADAESAESAERLQEEEDQQEQDGREEETNTPVFWDGETEVPVDEGRGTGSYRWLRSNPFGCPTVREMFLFNSGRPVYRDMLVCEKGNFGNGIRSAVSDEGFDPDL